MAGPVREVLRAAALLGMDFAVPDLAIVLGRGVADLIPAVDEACAAGVLAESGSGLRFRHPLIRAALYDEHAGAGARRLAPRRRARPRGGGRAGRTGWPGSCCGRSADRTAAAEPMDEWMLTWLARTADPLVGQAPGVAASFSRRAVASSPAGSARHDWLASRLADALYRIGDPAAGRTGGQPGPGACHRARSASWTCTGRWRSAAMLAGQSAESLATLDQALASPGISARHRARLLVLAARTHSHLGEVEKAGRVAASALAAASEAGDNWAMGWALHVLTLVTAVQGHLTDALPLFDRALTVTEADPALTDLRLLLQINKAVDAGQPRPVRAKR